MLVDEDAGSSLDDLFEDDPLATAPTGATRRFRVEAGSASSKTVLVVDDEPMTRLTVVETVKRLGYAAIEASNGAEAVAAAKSQEPDLIILDVVMPEKSGIRVLEELGVSADAKSIPVIMLTVQSDRRTVGQALSRGAVDYMLKPINQAELEKRLRKYLEGEE